MDMVVALKGHLGRVLVVDDDPSMRKVCARLLSHEGWNVVVAENARAAIAAMDGGREHFDCVVSDVHMPEIDGFGLIAAIRHHDEELPVLLMTADPSLDGAVRAINSGAVSYLSKPFDHGALGSAVARAARRHGVARMRRRADSYTHEIGEDLAPRLDNALACAWMAFQPIVDLQTRTVFAYEALIRTEETSLQRPDVLITVAEKLGRVRDLGRVVRRAVARAMPTLPDGVLAFVNLHGLELDDEQLFDPYGELARYAPRVVLEITERIGLDPAVSASRVAMLRRMGYRIAVDDLGAGYAALGALASLEPEIVKLDMSLVRDMHMSPTKRRVVGAIATLVRELGGRVVAEGVEKIAERDAVLGCGIELLQGYLFARPSREIVVPAFSDLDAVS